MSHAVLMLAYNNVDLTRAAVESVLAQTIPIHLIVVDNGSTDGTEKMLLDYAEAGFSVDIIRYETNTSPTQVSNAQLDCLFKFAHYDHILCTANDVVFPPDFYEELLRWPRGIVCGSEVRSLPLPDMKPYAPVSENTPMSALLLRRWCYDAVVAKDGFFFDEQFWHYCSDCDVCLRIASCGIWGIQLNVPYLHHSSATITNSTPEIAAGMHAQASLDRVAFREKWGFAVTDLEYGQRAVDINFKG